MDVLKTTLFIIGTCIGAGFLSGAELVRFFHAGSFVPPVLLSCCIFASLCAYFLRLGKRYGGYRGAVRALFGRGASVVFVLIPALAFIPCAGMLAGLDALCPSVSPLLSLAGLLLVVCVLGRGMAGISALNLVLVPLLLAYVFFSGGELSLTYPSLQNGASCYFGGAVYAGMNVFLAAPALMDAGKRLKHTVLPSVLAGLLIAASAVFVLGRIYREGAGALNAEMPFLYVMRGSRVFYGAAALAILTSLASSLYGLLGLCGGLSGVKKYAARTLLLLAAFGLSRLGLFGIVTFFYPVSGFVGLSFSALCIFHEQLFKKHDEKVHSRG